MQKVDLGRDVHGPVDRVCVCCGPTEMVTMFKRSTMEYSLDACKEVEVVSRQCKWCTTTHSVNEVSTPPAVLVISHPKLTKVRGLKAQLEATLSIPVRVRQDPTASLCLVRGFDSIPVKFEMSQELSSAGASAAPIGPLPPSAPPSPAGSEQEESNDEAEVEAAAPILPDDAAVLSDLLVEARLTLSELTEIDD